MEENVENGPRELLAGKFANVDALVHAYEELEAEFTRRSQKLKALEEQAEAPACVPPDEELYRAASGNEQVKARILGDYIASCRGVNLLGGEGTGVKAPAPAPKTIREAGSLALGYFKRTNT